MQNGNQTQYFIIPGLGNSGPQHWQTWLEQTAPACTRIIQQEWDAPACSDWIRTIDETIKDTPPENVVLIGHSLGCATIAHWADTYGRRIKGALLVAPSDLEAPQYNFPATGFAPFPLQQLNFPSIAVASTDDPWVSIGRATQFASAWGSKLVILNNAGHINASSGFGAWPDVIGLLQQLQ